MYLQLADNTANFLKWEVFRPSTKNDILAHYYAYSDGTISPGFARIITALAAVVGTVFGMPQAGAMVNNALKKYRADLVSMMGKNNRAKYDSSHEKRRIVSVYEDYYNNPTYNNWMNSFVNKTAQECINAANGIKSGNLARAAQGCKIGDTAGCRWMGLNNCQVQYLILLAAEKELAANPPPARPPARPPGTPPNEGGSTKDIALLIGAISLLTL